MSDEIQVRSRCSENCVNGHVVVDHKNRAWDIVPCQVCDGKGYIYRWVAFEEAGINISMPYGEQVTV